MIRNAGEAVNVQKKSWMIVSGQALANLRI